ncbi:hypothetical protein CSOJ01_10502 [Colletotrichum sojae]|uniref:Uncharacterized protein n=1 Tax=Colletotrichum sojae TaxID=2175907 RepID=A0A8H6J0V5_9PEZI|nr:hypothetical protein CSOJ01_10502 [Colletotrichum sojae]
MSFFSKEPPWEHAKDSCGTEISTNVLPHGNRAWVAVGRAKEIFHGPLILRINQVLKMVDHEHVKVEYRLYMLGKTETTSEPFVMICCTNKAVGDRARDALRASRMCSDFSEAGFKFERIRYPLGSVCASQPLAGERSSWDPSREPEDGHVEGPARDATGGVLIRIGDAFFQLTTEHIWDDSSADEDTASHDDDKSEIWSMDGLDEDDDLELSQLDHDILSQASITPEPSIMSPSMISLELSHAGMVSIQASEGAHPGLEHAAVSIVPPNVSDLVNGVVVPDGPSQRRHLRIRGFAKAGSEEKRVFLMADTNDFKSGVLLPETTMFKRKDLDSFKEMQLVQLDGIVTEGECGAAVLDQTHGTFYGYLVRGCPGTSVAYIVPATALFADMSSRGLEARLASSDISNLVSYGESPIVQDKPAPTPGGRRLSLDNPLSLSSKESHEFWSFLLDSDSPHIARVFANFSHGATLEALRNRKDERRNIWLHQWDSGQFGRPIICNASDLLTTRAMFLIQNVSGSLAALTRFVERHAEPLSNSVDDEKLQLAIRGRLSDVLAITYDLEKCQGLYIVGSHPACFNNVADEPDHASLSSPAVDSLNIRLRNFASWWKGLEGREPVKKSPSRRARQEEPVKKSPSRRARASQCAGVIAEVNIPPVHPGDDPDHRGRSLGAGLRAHKAHTQRLSKV